MFQEFGSFFAFTESVYGERTGPSLALRGDPHPKKAARAMGPCPLNGAVPEGAGNPDGTARTSAKDGGDEAPLPRCPTGITTEA